MQWPSVLTISFLNLPTVSEVNSLFLLGIQKGKHLLIRRNNSYLPNAYQFLRDSFPVFLRCVCHYEVFQASLFMSAQMIEKHLIHGLFLYCLKLFTQNAFDSWVDTVISIPTAALSDGCYWKNVFFFSPSSTRDFSALSDPSSLSKRITELNTQ